jgi:6-phosphogluconolactonase (cycloisomerase 2 family)
VTGTSGSATTTATVCVTVGTASGNCSSSSASTSGNFYVLNAATDQVAGYYVNAGALTPLFNALTLPAAKPLSMAIAPNGAFLYISTAGGIFDYTISSGQLTLASTTPISQDQAISMQVSPDSNWLLEIQSGSPYVYAIAINSSNGTLASTNEIERTAGLSATTPEQVAISPDGTYVFVAMGSGTNSSGAATAGGTAIVPFNASNSTAPFGAVSTIPTVSPSGSALSVAVDPLQSGQTTPRLFYVGETEATSGSTNTGGLRVFDFGTLGSGLKEITGSPFSIAGLAPYSILPISTGNYVYVVNRQTSSGSTGVIAGFSISASNSVYTLTPLGSTFNVGTNPVALAEDGTGTFVFAVDFGGSPDLKGYTFDSTNAGYLDAAVSAATGTDPVQASAIVAAP